MDTLETNEIDDFEISTNHSLLRVHHLKVSFRGDQHQLVDAVKGICFDIPYNSTVALVGESGSGKSVSSLAIMGLLSSDNAVIAPSSQIEFEGRQLLRLSNAERRQMCGKDIAMIFQEPMTSLNPVFTVGYQIEEVLRLHMLMGRKRARARAIALLEEVGIPSPEEKIHAYPNQLSGGQQQRVMIAMAIACEPKLLIADEPTTALDVTIQKQIIDLIESLRKKHHISVLFITHDLALVGEIADQVIVMRNGEIREKGDVRQILESPKDSYTKALLRCRPSLESRPWRLPVISDFINELGEENVDSITQDSKQRSRGLAGNEDVILDVRNLGEKFL